jgi:hypothetical protein
MAQRNENAPTIRMIKHNRAWRNHRNFQLYCLSCNFRVGKNSTSQSRSKSLRASKLDALTLTFKGFHDENNEKAQFPLFQCEDNSVEFVLIPGGSFTMGLLDALEEELYNLIVETYKLEELPYDEVVETDDGAIF